jgi:EAL domain-containing protein (putative c-di-GMP-specific phosphodiesterase class I)
LRRHRLAPERLELEITEGVLIKDVEQALTTLRQLKALGVRIAMDDFGTGYSSLSYLQRFPFDKIKIDRSFVAELMTSPDAAAIVRAVLRMGHSLGMRTVAEGVESDSQVTFLTAEGCDDVQGFYYAAPMSAVEMGALYRAAADAAAEPAAGAGQRTA